MQNFLIFSYICVSLVTFQLTSMDLESSLLKFSTTLRNLENLLFLSAQTSTKSAPLQDIGKQVLAYTNEFRAQQGKSPLQWNKALADLATEHSKNMALGKVPFGHAGFKERIARVSFRLRGAAENVYMSSSGKNIARATVNAWINSPGHRKNLLGKYRLCGIGVYKNPKKHWYLTQIFAL